MMEAIPFSTHEVASLSRGYQLGSRHRDGANEYILLQGAAGLEAGMFVTFDELGVTTLLDSGDVGAVAVACADPSATEVGWFLVSGSGEAQVASSADNAKLFATATDGVADDAVVDGDLIHGAIARSASDDGVATVQLFNPYVNAETDAIA